jgi:hypothetical protein
MSAAGGLFFQAADGARQGVVPQGWLRLHYGEGYWVVPVGDARSLPQAQRAAAGGAPHCPEAKGVVRNNNGNFSQYILGGSYTR